MSRTTDDGYDSQIQSLNRYAYVLNNPTTLTDPSGLCSEPDSSYIDSNGVVQVVGSEPCWWQIFGLGFCTVTGGFGCGDNGPNANVNPSGGGASGGGSAPAPAPKPTPPTAAPQKNVNPCAPSGNAPSPSYFESRGLTVSALEALPVVPTLPGTGGLPNPAGVALNGYNLFSFHRGGSLDAQAYGASPAYGNYAFGVYMGAVGYSLPFTLSAANQYGHLFSSYRNPANPMDLVFSHIPAANVSNITAGYNDQRKGTLCSAQ